MKKTFNLFALLVMLGLVFAVVACKKTEAPTTEKPTTTQTDKQTDATTTEDPGTTTEDPGSTTEEPGSTTEEPGSTTEDPSSVTEDPGTTTEHTHTWDEGRITTDPTCTTKGVKTYTCSCGETRTEEVDALGHDLVEDAAVAATCTEAGKTAGHHCSRCDYTDGGETIEALGHDYQWVIDQEATVLAAGKKHEECTRCHDKRNEDTVIPMLDHEHQLTLTEAVAATCTTAGSKAYYTCSVCNKHFEDAAGQLEIADLEAYLPIAALDHDYKEQLSFEHMADGYVETYKVCSRDNSHTEFVKKSYLSVYDIVDHATATASGDNTSFTPNLETMTWVVNTMTTKANQWTRFNFTASATAHKYAYVVVRGNDASICIGAKVDADNNPYDTIEGNKQYKGLGTDTIIIVWDLETLNIDSTKINKIVFWPYSKSEEVTTGEFTVLGGGLCNVLAEATEAAVEHQPQKVEAVAPKWNADGNIEYYRCSCGKLYTFADDKYTEVTAQDVVVPMTGLNYGTAEAPLTVTEALAEMAKMANNETTTTKAFVKGFVVSAAYFSSGTYNLYLAASLDSTDTVYATYCKPAEGVTADVTIGSEVVVSNIFKADNKHTVLGSSSSTTDLLSVTAEAHTPTYGTAEAPLTVAQAVAEAKFFVKPATENAYVKGVVKDFVTGNNKNAINIWDGSDETTIINVFYKTFPTSNYKQPAVGEEIIVKGKFTAYYETMELTSPEIISQLFTLTFEMGNGTAIEAMQVKTGTPASALSTIEVTPASGYYFIKWQMKYGENYVDIPNNATVQSDLTLKAIYGVDKTNVSVDVDIYSLTSNNTANTYTFALSEEQTTSLFNEAISFTSATFVSKQGTSYDVSYNAGFKLARTENAEGFTFVPAGEYTVYVENNGTTYKFNAILITKIISSGEELINITDYTTVTRQGTSPRDGKPAYTYDGYFVLGNNINLTGMTIGRTFSPTFWAITTYSDTLYYGLVGTFDGRGHTIYGGTYNLGGLFGTIGQGGTVKNLAVINAVINNDLTGVLGTRLDGAHLENILVDVTTGNSNVAPIVNAIANDSSAKNLVIYFKGTSSNNANALMNYNLPLENVYVISDNPLGATPAGTYYVYAYGTTCENINFQNLPADLWVLTGEKAVFKSTQAVVDEANRALLNSIEVGNTVKRGASLEVSLPQGATLTTNNYSLEGANEFVTVNGGIVSISSSASQDFTFDIVLSYKGLTRTVNVSVDTSLLLLAGPDYLFDLYGQDDIEFDVPGVTTATIKVTINEVEKTYTVTNEKVTVPYNDVKDLTGEFEYEMEYNANLYKGVLVVATKVITTAEELLNITDYTTVTRQGTSTRDSQPVYAYDGYFVLGNNIDLTGKEIARVMSPTGWSVTIDGDSLSYGLLGTFDGRGYTLYGGTYKDGGLFGWVGTGATVKNLAIVNATLAGGMCGVFGTNIRGALIENVLVDITTYTAYNAAPLSVYIGSGTLLKNVVIYCSDNDSQNSYSVAWGNSDPMQNVYVISNQATGVTSTGIQTFALGTTCANVGFTGLDTDMWVLTGDKAVFVSTAEFLD